APGPPDEWLPPPRPATRRLPATRARAMATAPSHVRLAVTGDHPKGHTPGGAGTVPVGSHRQQRPSWARAPRVTSMQSLLVEVLSTGPAAARMEGITTEVVFPDRGGPSTRAACSGRAHTHPLVPSPRSSGCPRSAMRALTASPAAP